MTTGGQQDAPLVYDTVMLYPSAGLTGPQGPEGPPGEDGRPGPASSGPVMWTGAGEPPEWIEGAKAGDTYLDTITGNIYTLT